MWRQEDVFMALGQGIDASTGHKVQTDDELAKKGAGRPPPVVLLNTPPLDARRRAVGHARPAGPGQHHHPDAEVRRRGGVEHRRAEGANSVLIAGDAMGRPMIEALEAEPDRWDLSSLFAVTSSAALFSVPVKERFFDADARTS